MNSSSSKKSSSPAPQEDTYAKCQAEAIHANLTRELSLTVNHPGQADASATLSTDEEPLSQVSEAGVEEAPQYSNAIVDIPQAEILPSYTSEQAAVDAEQSLENPIASTLAPIRTLPEGGWIELGGEKLPLMTVLEGLLFVADNPVAPAQLAKVLNCELGKIECGLQALAQMYEKEARGLRLQERDGKFLLITTPAVAPAIEDFLNLDTSIKLSGPALETLAVIAYRQPITRIQIEAVRGVDSAGVLRSLVQRGLVEEIGRLDVAGRPLLYGVTDLFLQHFGLTKIADLPPLQSTEADTLWATTKLAELNALTT